MTKGINCSWPSASPTPCPRPSGSGRRRRRGFTLIELLVVVVVIAILAALLMPAIGAAVRRAREASVTAEINLLAAALTSFRANHGDYPPSRVLICEDGGYGVVASSTPTYSYTSPSGDISDQDLAARSVAALRKAFPRMVLSTQPSRPIFAAPYSTATGWYDVNGNGGAAPDAPYVLDGTECLAFFLGGIPQPVPAAPGGKATFSMTGFGKDPSNPFRNGGEIGARPLFEFRESRLVDLDGDGFPAYLDGLNTGMPFAYFSSYGGAGYDPNDVDLAEADDSGAVNPITLKFAVTFPVKGGGLATSAAPNPYSVGPTAPATPGATFRAVGWQRPQSFQILSAGYDGLWGVGGRYGPDDPAALPVDAANTNPANDPLIRVRERDNLTSFSLGRLE